MPKPARLTPASPKVKRGRGQPRFEPTSEQRAVVEACTAFGIPQDQIAQLIINPHTGNPVSESVMREKFRAEIATGATKFHLKVASGAAKNATTPTPMYPGGHPGSQRFILCARFGWRVKDDEGEGQAGLPAPLDGATPREVEERNSLEVARRVAFLLRRADRQKQQAATPPALPGPPKPIPIKPKQTA
jgi:hypothetical protein